MLEHNPIKLSSTMQWRYISYTIKMLISNYTKKNSVDESKET